MACRFCIRGKENDMVGLLFVIRFVECDIIHTRRLKK